MRLTTPRSHSTARNSVSMLTGQLLSKGTLFVSLMILSRYLDDSHFGMLVFAVVLGQIIIFMADLGVSVISNRKFSLEITRMQELYSTSLGLRFITCITAWVLLALVSSAAGYGTEQTLMILLVGLGSSMEACTELQYSVFRAGERMIFEALTRMAGGIAALALVLLVVFADLGPLAASATYTIRALVMLATSFAFLGRFKIRIHPNFSGKRMAELLRESWPLGVMGLLFVAFQRLDNVFIRELSGVEAVGAYQESYRILETFVLLITPSLLPGALFPSLCRAFEAGREEVKSRMVSIAQLVTGIAGAVMIPMFAGGIEFFRLIWGHNFLRGLGPEEVGTTFILLLAAIPVVFWMNYLLASVIASGRQKVTLPVTSIALTISIVGNLLLIPQIGIRGAAVMVLSANFIMSMLYYMVLRRDGPLPLLKHVWKPIVAALVSIPLIFLTADLPMTIRMVVPTAAYLILWLILGGAEMLLRKQETTA